MQRKSIRSTKLASRAATDGEDKLSRTENFSGRVMLSVDEEGHTWGTVQVKIMALDEIVSDDITGLPAKKAQYREQLEEYYRQLESRAEIVFWDERAAFRARE